MNERATLLFYCQHSLGMGHLVRSLALAAGLQKRFRVVFLNGGPLPKKIRTPDGVEMVNLPPLGFGPDGKLVSRDRRRTVERARQQRRRIILETYHELRPQVVFIELFPFGRKKFADELLPLLEEARSARPSSLVCCSLRDILVGKKQQQQEHDERAVKVANTYFDAVLVHSDPSFARLEESLSSYASLNIPVHYTGFVQAEQETAHGAEPHEQQKQVLVSAGGGLVGETLFRTAIEAYSMLRRADDLRMKIVTGPFLPEDSWQALCDAARAEAPGLSLKRFVPDLCAEMRNSVASVSQCGYNTALDILRAGVPALVVPFSEGEEDEQLKRARRLERLAALRVLEQPQMNAARFAAEVRALLDFKPRQLSLDLDGARNTAQIVESLLHARRSKRVAPVKAIEKGSDGAGASDWLDELRRALDATSRPVAFFFRDDDAGWRDDRLFKLLDLFAHHSMPLDVAAIPGALTASLAAELRARIAAEPTRVAVHQHGFNHLNHEPEGRRKCEFGIARGPARQRSDIEQGKSLLADLFGPLVSPIFTPPWNRCTSVTGECLLETGIRVLSRDATAAPLGLDGLVELPITIDWFARARGTRVSLDELGRALAAAVKTNAPVGIMFHHALMDKTERQRACELLALLASRANAQCYLMEQLITGLSQDSAAQVHGHAAAWPPVAMPATAPAERK